MFPSGSHCDHFLTDGTMKPFMPCGFIILYLLFSKRYDSAWVYFPDTMFMISDEWPLVFTGSMQIQSFFWILLLSLHLLLFLMVFLHVGYYLIWLRCIPHFRNILIIWLHICRLSAQHFSISVPPGPGPNKTMTKWRCHLKWPCVDAWIFQ